MLPSRLTCCLLTILALPAAAEPDRRVENDGMLILEDVPAIPDTLVDELARYQNIRSATFQDWNANGTALYVRTRFGDVAQLHRVDEPGGTRRQLTWLAEPLSGIRREPLGDRLLFTKDVGGNEMTQIHLFDPATGSHTVLTDGIARNRGALWNRDGSAIAWRSTRRNGINSDIWLMDVAEPDKARLLFETPDATSWSPADFSPDNRRILVGNYVSANEASIHELNVADGTLRRLRGDPSSPARLYVAGYDANGSGYFFVTDEGGEFVRLAWASVDDPTEMQVITGDIDWDVETFVLSPDRSRAAFVVNEGGRDALYLFDTGNFRYRRVSGLPVGLIGRVRFRPDGRALAMTLNTAQTPSDTFVLSLKRSALRAGELTRWTNSEVGGLDTSSFITPKIVSVTSFDNLEVPAFVYMPAGPGPHPVIVSIHGGPESQARPGFSSTYQMWLAQLGAAIVVPNVRGSDGYGKSYLKLDNGRLREDSVRDIGAVLDWIGEQPTLDAKRVAVYGGSYGGYMVLASAVHYSDRLAAAVEIVGISNFVTFLTNTQSWRRDLRRVEYGDERDPAMRQYLNDISPLGQVERIRIPMLVAQGANDPRVPASESAQLVEALRAQDQDVWYLNALNEGHGFRKKANRDIYQQATVMFLREHLESK